MAAYKKFDPRIDALVIETKTFWDSEIGDLSDEDKSWLASQIHKSPQQATQIAYERSHTGFTREITVTLQDIERLYDQKIAE